MDVNETNYAEMFQFIHKEKKSDNFEKWENIKIFLVEKNNFIIPLVTKMNIKYLDLV